MPRSRACSSDKSDNNSDSYSDDCSDSDCSDSGSDSGDCDSDNTKRRRASSRSARPPPAAKARDRTEGAASYDCAGVYVLRNVESGVCYVGKSDNVARHIVAHHCGYHGSTATLWREPMRTRGSAADLESYTKDIRVI